MESTRAELKDKAVRLRKKGFSIVKIEQDLNVSRSTLSGWLKAVNLTEAQKQKLFENKNKALVAGRKKAVIWHNQQKDKRLQEAKNQAQDVLKSIDTKNKYIMELALSILYFGEGGKSADDTTLGSTDPLILKFFLTCLEQIYNFDINRVRCELYIRADQNPDALKRFWSRELKVPIKNFKGAFIDKRTAGSKSFDYYKGVCSIRCNNVAIKRRLLNLSRLFCEKIISRRV
ncbi:MAG: hypothetical protein UW30_C0002G0061 [Candidatus Giovannonibacteria bacterium GW2011_GWA2_44_13b]|uniref:Uncharacterized protein n=2 Tax=Candidatus Giovannoniibacteriota TaxID=1752738 RepID=A0A0G1H5U5_9BACT|nr:MAG: hypothetical protein UW30_C0002G0061 [Candidatus Giovannonibacteria bacterium GW2011_GWA2_44_13b]OGF81618.1 MAG: hypothetical protein A2924_02645 [Candidatus Giovannonibacteria bacterium RIFCSPLOWO2_01_FULL_44_16]